MAQMTEQSRRESRDRSNMGIGQRAAFDARKKQEQNASPKKEDVPAAPNPYELETARIAAAQKARFDQPAAGADIRESQTRLAKMLEDQASGKAPSVAEAQMRQAMDRSIAGQQASLAGARGIDPGLAMRMMARQGAEQRAELGQAAGIARLQGEREAAETAKKAATDLAAAILAAADLATSQQKAKDAAAIVAAALKAIEDIETAAQKAAEDAATAAAEAAAKIPPVVAPPLNPNATPV